LAAGSTLKSNGEPTQILNNYSKDLKGEYETLQNGPLASPQQPQFYKTESLTPKICSSCANLPICRLADQMPSWATGCQYYKKGAVVNDANPC
jgi:hypothetical protein